MHYKLIYGVSYEEVQEEAIEKPLQIFSAPMYGEDGNLKIVGEVIKVIKLKQPDGTELEVTCFGRNFTYMTNGSYNFSHHYTDKDGVTHCWDHTNNCERTFILEDSDNDNADAA